MRRACLCEPQGGRASPSRRMPRRDGRSQLRHEDARRATDRKAGVRVRYISLFSGVEAATLAWEPLGWEPVAFAEIEPFPSAVLAHRWPDVPNLGDVTQVDWSKYRGTVDLVVGGSPCQAFSVAGKREGLMDERGQLMLEYVRAVAEVKPRWFLWENVPGVLSQDKGRAFGTLLGEMADLGYSCAWRVLDAQFFGVAQRRRRVFLVGCLGGGAGAAAAVLFEPESVSGNTQTSKQKREALASDARGRAASSGGGVTAFAQNTRDEVRIQGDGTISGALSAQPGMKQQTYLAECLTPWDAQSKRVFSQDGLGPTLYSGERSGQQQQSVLTNSEPCVMASGQANAEVCEGGLSPTLTILHEAPVLATVKTCSHPSAPQTAASSSSTTNPSTAAGSCSTRDWSGPDAICMADDNARAAVDENLSGSLKVGGVRRSLRFV